MKVRLKRDELDYLLAEELLPSELIATVAASAENRKSDDYILEISEDEAEEIRERSEERLPSEGFDKNYEPNSTGRILESLIDKFFVPDG